VLLLSALLAACGGAGNGGMPASRSARPADPRTSPPKLGVRRIGRLPAPLQLPAATSLPGGQTLVLGGLSASDTSSDGIALVASSGSARAVGRLPSPVHDAAAASVGGQAYLFGGGDAAPSSAILRVGKDGGTAGAGRLPAGASDLAAATIGNRTYVVGGYTGTAPLRSIVAFTPGRPARVVASLGRPLRYASVAAVGNTLLIAGGTSGTAAQRAILRFDPRTGRVTRIGSLERPLTHAAGVALGGRFYLIGGRGPALDSASDAIWSVDPASGRVSRAGRLPAALSDVAAVSDPSGILLIGGRDAGGHARDEVLRAEIRPQATPSRTTRHSAVPPLLSRRDVYAADRAGRLSAVVRRFPARIYVPNSKSNTVDEIDQRTFRIVRHFQTGALPQHVTPSYDLRTLWVDNDEGNSLTPIDPRTGRPGRTVPVADPYNLYFTPSGRYAIVVAERLRRLDFRDAHSMKLRHSLSVPTCPGVDHMDFTANGRYALASCEFGGSMIVVDIPRQRVVRTVRLRAGAMPQDVKLSPDGQVFYVADMASHGVWKIAARRFRKAGFVDTGRGAHGLYASRDARVLYVSNRGEGTISLISFKSQRVVRKWRLPGPASPDMGGVSANGRVLWLSGRYNAEVYAISTRSGRLIKRIKVGAEPHGLCVYPQPGRYSLGHTGVFR
jgi:YncE-like protein/Kelch motif protein